MKRVGLRSVPKAELLKCVDHLGGVQGLVAAKERTRGKPVALDPA